MKVKIKTYENSQFTAMVIIRGIRAYGYGFTAREAFKNAYHSARRYARVWGK